MTCDGGKYDSQAVLLNDFNNLKCKVSANLAKITTSMDLATELWDMNLNDLTKAEYGCLNANCRADLH